MQETRNNCFGSKKRSTTLLQAKTVKHECRNVTATYKTKYKIKNFFAINSNFALVFGFVRCCYISSLVLNCFRLKKGRVTFFWPETIVANFLHSMVLLHKVLFNHTIFRYFKIQVVMPPIWNFSTHLQSSR